MMNIKVAGENKTYIEGLTLSELIALEEVQMPQYVTVSVNDQFVDQNDFEKTKLADGDEVEFLYFMGGGK